MIYFCYGFIWVRSFNSNQSRFAYMLVALHKLLSDFRVSGTVQIDSDGTNLHLERGVSEGFAVQTNLGGLGNLIDN